MTVLKRNRPLSLRYLHALLPRISPTHTHFKDLQKEAAIRQKGFNGEVKLDYHLNMLAAEFTILHDITLTYYETTFQIDSLILSPFALYIIDSKSIDGTLHFNTNLQQLIQYHQGVETSYKYPLTQLESIKFLLMKWLQVRKLAGLPIFYFVSIAEASSIFQVTGNEDYIRKIVTYAEGIPHFIMRKNKQLSKISIAQPEVQKKITAAIIKERQDFYIDLAHKYDIKRDDIAPGIVCKKCYQLQTTFQRGYWVCANCSYKDKQAFQRGLRDYFILFGNGISNKEARWFLGVHNRSTATRILQRSKLTYQKQHKKWYHTKS